MAFFWGDGPESHKPPLAGRRGTVGSARGGASSSGIGGILGGGANAPVSQPSQQQLRQEWQQEAQLREEMWQRQTGSSSARGSQGGTSSQFHLGYNSAHSTHHHDPSTQSQHRYQHSQQASPFGSHVQPGSQPSSRQGPRNRRPSPYRDETAPATGRGSLAPPQGADPLFDERVKELHGQKQFLRGELWKEFGGGGEPAEPGALPAFDQAVDRAWNAFRDQKRERQEVQASSASALVGTGATQLSGSTAQSAGGAGAALGILDTPRSRPPPRTPFEADVHAEMDRLMAGLRQELLAEHHGQPAQQPLQGGGSGQSDRRRTDLERRHWPSGQLSQGMGNSRQPIPSASDPGHAGATRGWGGDSSTSSLQHSIRATQGYPNQGSAPGQQGPSPGSAMARTGRRGYSSRAAQSSIQLG